MFGLSTFGTEGVEFGVLAITYNDSNRTKLHYRLERRDQSSEHIRQFQISANGFRDFENNRRVCFADVFAGCRRFRTAKATTSHRRCWLCSITSVVRSDALRSLIAV